MELLTAIRSKDTYKIDELISSGTDIHYMDSLGISLIHYATSNGLIETVKRFLDSGVDANLVAQYRGYTPLFHAAVTDNLDMVDLLVSYGADPLVTDFRRQTVLHVAATLVRSRQMCKKLISLGVSVNCRDSFDNTPLHWAADTGNMEFIIELVKNGADVFATNHRDKTPIDLAEIELQWTAFEYLKECMNYEERIQQCPRCNPNNNNYDDDYVNHYSNYFDTNSLRHEE